MKFISLSCFFILSFQVLCANYYPVSVTSAYSTSNPFRGVDKISLPTDGELLSAYYFTNDAIFDGGNTYLRVHHLPDSPNWDVSKFWQYNHSAQTFTLDIVELSPGARWRPISTTSSGSLYYLGWVNLNTGINTISLTAQAEDRQYAGFTIDGSLKFRKFSHSFASFNPSLPTTAFGNFGYEELLVSVPESQTYALILGVLAIAIALKRCKQRDLEI